MNTLKIEIPEGKEIDWKKSEKQNRIVLKDKQLTYKEICKKIFTNGYYFIDEIGGIEDSIKPINEDILVCGNNATSKHQLECIRAKNLLANVAKYLNDGWEPLYESSIFLLVSRSTGVSVIEAIKGSRVSDCGGIWFKSEELAQQAIEILGEKTVKLALEPLGI